MSNFLKKKKERHQAEPKKLISLDIYLSKYSF